MGTGVCAGFKGTLSTLPIPKIDSGSSAETMHITMEVGRAGSREGGGSLGELGIVE